MTDVIEQQRRRAIEALEACCAHGFLRASADPGGHTEVWARDSMIAGLGILAGEVRSCYPALEASIAQLAGHQTPSGALPNNVNPDNGRPNFRAYADGGLWYVITSSQLTPDGRSIASLLNWYECQNVDQTGLLSMQESADWQDLFCTRGKGLYLNCLYVMALRAADQHTEADRTARQINRFFWYEGDGQMLRHITHSFSTDRSLELDSLGRKRWVPQKRLLVNDRYYLPYLSFRECGEWFDVLGNVLAILSGIADEAQSAATLDFIERHGLAAHPAAALSPVVQPGDPDWRDYYGALNAPHHYHNGGIWPFIGGFYVAALVKCGRLREAAAALERLARLNEAGEFNEWHHGLTAQPMGVRRQAWSAAMFVYACECVKRQQIMFL